MKGDFIIILKPVYKLRGKFRKNNYVFKKYCIAQLFFLINSSQSQQF